MGELALENFIIRNSNPNNNTNRNTSTSECPSVFVTSITAVLLQLYILGLRLLPSSCA